MKWSKKYSSKLLKINMLNPDAHALKRGVNESRSFGGRVIVKRAGSNWLIKIHASVRGINGMIRPTLASNSSSRNGLVT